MGEVGFVEVAPCYLSAGRWKEITIDTGAAQSTLRDIKLPDSAGGYAYRNSNEVVSATRNRFIYWRTSNDILELSEVCLDVNLLGNQLRLRFQNTPILEGISVHERADHVVVLVPTVASLHRLIFPHPDKITPTTHLGSLHPADISRQSIFFDASVSSFRDPLHYHLLNHNSVGMLQPHTSCSWLSDGGESVFVLANTAGSLLVLAMASAQEGGGVCATEMRHTSVMGRLWSGLVPSVMRSGQESEEVALSLVSHAVGHDVLIFALCRDLKIRMWSYEKKECLMTKFVLKDHCDPKNTMSWNVTGHQPCLRKAVDHVNSAMYLAVFWGFPEERQFFIFQPVVVGGQYHLNLVSALHSSESDLVDFCLTSSYIWTLWLNENNETIVLYTTFTSLLDEKNHCWKSVVVDASSPFQCGSRFGLGVVDPREAYMREIFSMGRFAKSTICKAISIYRRTPESTFSAENTVLSVLKADVTSAIENEIHTRANEAELADDEFQRLQLECWEKFYSYCVQYHEVGTKPLGLIIDEDTGIVGIIKKNMFSLLRPCDTLEHLVLSDATDCGLKFMTVNPLVAEDPSLSHSLQCVLECVRLIQDFLTEEALQSLMHGMANLQAPETIASNIVDSYLMLAGNSKNGGEHLMVSIKRILQTAPHILQAIHVLLNGLDLSQGQPDIPWGDGDGPHPASAFLYGHLFNGPVALMVVSESLHQMAEFRFSFSFALLLLLLMTRQFGENVSFLPDRAESISSVLVPQLSMFVQAYYFMLWASEAEVTPVPSSVLESGFKQLSLLDSSDFPSLASRLHKSDIQPKTLVSLFVQEQGGSQARQLLSRHPINEGEAHGPLWVSMLPPMVNTTAQLIWPMNANFVFPEFLLTQCQYLHIQEYVRLLKGWCEPNNFSRLFLLANSYLALGEPLKAVDLVRQAAEGASQEAYLCAKFALPADENRAEDPQTTYYLKVIQLFEYFNHPDCIVALASSAIASAPKDDPQIPTLWSLLFKYHLEVGHYEQAYAAMISNPDSSRRKDCLRQFVVVLCERSRLEELVSFPYANMEEDVVSILEGRARSTDLTCHNYYDLLYAFYIKNNNFRRAGTVMYEFGMRLSREVPGVESLQKRVCCYLVAINCLRLVDPAYAWIVKPIPADATRRKEIADDEALGRSPKRDADGEEKSTKSDRKIEVLDLSDIRKEYDLASAHLQLCSRVQGAAVALLTPEETVALLVNAGMFETALAISQAYDLSLKPVFEGLASKCVSLSTQLDRQHPSLLGDEFGSSLDWLAEADTGSMAPSVQDQAWFVLQHYLGRCERDGQTLLHRCVVEKLLSLGVAVPAWLTASYKKRNMAELLLLLNMFGHVEEAVDLVIEYLDAVMGKGVEHFSLRNAIHATSPPVWVPYTRIDELRLLLEENRHDAAFIEMRKKLDAKLKEYTKLVESTSQTRKQLLLAL